MAVAETWSQTDSPSAYVPRLGEPLGPDTLTWRLVGDYRWMLVGMRAGLLQTMHPAVNQALRDHDSTYFQGPMKRILRSLPQILGVVYDEDAAATGAKVRSYHKPLEGRLPDGSDYHALSPDVFYWPHATFFEAQIAAMEFFGTPLSQEQKERLYQESVQWYSLYGMSMKPVPASYRDFCSYWDEMIDSGLEINSFARGTFRKRKGAFGASPFRWVPEFVWRPVSDVQYAVLVWVLRGTFPPRLRERMDLAWTPADERKLRALRAVLALLDRLPLQWRLVPQARAAWRRQRGQRGMGSPSSEMH
jgi:uncharacterized protein (DUF2236 family)